MKPTEERTTHLPPEEVDRLLTLIRDRIEDAQKKEKRVEVIITNGFHEWEQAPDDIRRRLDGSCEVFISIPADRLMAEPVTKKE